MESGESDSGELNKVFIGISENKEKIYEQGFMGKSGRLSRT